MKAVSNPEIAFNPSEFLNPSVAWRGKPLWCWNGKLEQDELIRQVHVLKEMGMGGFFIHSRIGLATEYLGEEWLAMVNACTEEAAACGLESWLYDEDKWPSGTAAGMVTANPDYRMKFIYLEIFAGGAFDFESWMTSVKHPLGCWSCDSRGDIDIFNPIPLDASTAPETYAEKTILTFRIECGPEHAYVDTLKREATDEFIRLTHEKYKKHCGRYFGKEIKGIFTDEPHRGPMLSGFGGHVEGLDSINLLPWTEQLFDLFEERYAYRVEAHLPEMFLRYEGQEVSRIKHQYNELLLDLFLKNYAKPYYDWCEANNLMSTGHILHENTLSCQVSNAGSVQPYYQYMHVPGIDYLGEHGRHYWVAKQVDSVARQFDRPWVLSELYGLSGWQVNFESIKAIGAWQALFGVNVRSHHLSWYNMAGASKRDYPTSFLHQSPWYKEYDFVESWFARLGYFRSQGKPCCDLLVLNPVESLWGRVYPGAIEHMCPQDKVIAEIQRQYEALFHILAGNHIDFDYGDEGLLKTVGNVEQAEGETFLRLGSMTYTTVLVAGLDTIRSSTLELLRRFADSGGRVIFAGAPPAYVDAERSDQAGSFAVKNTRVEFSEHAIVSALDGHTPSRVRIVEAGTGRLATEVFCQLRQDESACYLTVLNSNRDDSCDLKIVLRGIKHEVVEEWDLESGAAWRVPAQSPQLSFPCRLAPSQARCYRMVRESSIPEQPSPAVVGEDLYALGNVSGFELDEPNVCVLDLAEWSVDEEPLESIAEILPIDRTIRKRLGVPLREENSVQPWVRMKDPFPVLGRVRLQYTFELRDEALLDGTPLYLVVETPDRFEVSINGESIKTDADEGFWCDIALRRVSLPSGCFRQGRNTIVLETDFREDINLEAIYLLGDFAVQMNGTMPVICTLPTTVALSDLVSQGFPYYSGTFRYTFETPVALVGKACRITLPAFEGAYAKIISGDKEELIPWRPHETILVLKDTFQVEVSITRKNTFGPLHLKETRPRVTHPGSFSPNGERYSLVPVFLESGLLGNIQIQEIMEFQTSIRKGLPK